MGFLERYYPALDIKDRSGAPTRIYVEYSRERRQPPPNLDDWKCTLVSSPDPNIVPQRKPELGPTRQQCHFDNFSRRATCKQCKAPRSCKCSHNPYYILSLTPRNAAENAIDMRLDGQSDECPQQTPSQFVVVRGLASSTNETILAAGVKKTLHVKRRRTEAILKCANKVEEHCAYR